MASIQISGKITARNIVATPALYQDVLHVVYQQEITLDPTAKARELSLDALEDDALLELEYDGGYKRWQRVTAFNAAENTEVAGLKLKYLRVISTTLSAAWQYATVDQILEQLESLHIAQAGLYRCADPNALNLQAITPENLGIDTRKPVLLWLHGAWENTASCFGELWESRQGYHATAYLQRLFAPYGEQVFTLEQHTLTVSPIQHALAVLRSFPDQTRLHIISHGLGGLVGELLSQLALKRRTRQSNGEFLSLNDSGEALFTELELQAFASAERQADWQALQEINQLCRQKHMTVERFVRVACPARGSALASNSVEDQLSLLFNVANLTPTLRTQHLADFLRMTLMAVTLERTSVANLVGLEALLPTSPLIRLLNRPQVQLDADLSVIAGNVKSAGLLGRFKAWVNHCFAGEDHDYMVNTSSMYGGAPRTQGMRFYLDQREDSGHFAYFADALVRERLLNALQRPTEDARFTDFAPTYFSPEQTLRAATDTAMSGVVPEKKSVLYFLPAWMGSTLKVDAQPLWLDMAMLAWGDFSRLAMDTASVTADGVLESAYRPLLAQLESKHRVVPFAWDWRRSVLEAGRRLGEALTHELDDARDGKRKLVLRLLAHAAGGLVVQAMLSEMPQVWQRLQQEADCRLVLLGTPFNGTYAALQLLLGQHRLLTLLDMLDDDVDAAEAARLQAQLATYPALYELLPEAYLQESAWQSLLGDAFNQWEGQALLADAARVRQQLQQVVWDARYALYVHGRARLTPDAVERITTDKGVMWRFHASAAGDGVTLWNSITANTSASSALPMWYMPVEHGRMASRADQFTNLHYLLDDGLSRQLDQSPPAVETTDEWLPQLRGELFPDEHELIAAALGYHTRLTQDEVRPAVEVRVVHGNLTHAAYPIVVGHYDGDAILSAEAVLDKALNGRLSELLRIGLYPGALGTSHVFLNAGKRPAGAIVMGLGEIGKLTTGQLTASFARALLDYTLVFRENVERHSAEWLANQDASDFIPVHIATLLIGTVGGGSMVLADAITAIFRAIMQANLVLNKSERTPHLRLQVVEFVELYEDRAVEAARLIQDFVTLPEFRQDFTLKTLLQTASGARQRVTYSDPVGWWRRIQVEANQNGLKYTTLTDKARAELLLQATQRKLVDQFISKAEASSQQDAEVGKILFELLLPTEMKEQAPNTDNVVFVLDSTAAAYPWELLFNRLDTDSKPLAVRVGMLRQLQVGQYRQRVLNPLERAALVIGDPPTSGAFPRLAAARAEAESIATLLETNGFSRVVREIDTDAQSILRALHTQDYRVLHLAGHGVFQYQPDTNSDLRVTGMVLGDGIFLTPVEIGQMRRVPELAFINCCHLASLETTDETATVFADNLQDRSRLAASLAQELIRMGVRAVIAAGWAINDAAAKVFAETCYGALLKGHTFGSAVLMARRETWEQYPASNTWGAYQCYGDPDYKLLSRQPEQRNTTAADTWRFVAEVEVVAELQNLISMADSAKVEDEASLVERLQQLHRAIPAEWLNHAHILYALGRAYGKLNQLALAIEAYDDALDAPQADYPVTLLEEKVSLQTAWAVAWAQGKASAPPLRVAASPAELMRKSQQILSLLDGLGNSLERFSEEGKYWKRQALLAVGEERVHALKQMDMAYQKAHEFAIKATGALVGYPLVAWLTSKMVRYLRGEARQLERPLLKYWLIQAKQCVDHADRQMNNFSSGITCAEYHLLLYLYHALGARLDENYSLQKVISTYQAAIARGAAPRQLGFIREHLMFLREMLGEYQKEQATLQPVVLALLAIETELKLPN